MTDDLNVLPPNLRAARGERERRLLALATELERVEEQISEAFGAWQQLSRASKTDAKLRRFAVIAYARLRDWRGRRDALDRALTEIIGDHVRQKLRSP